MKSDKMKHDVKKALLPALAMYIYLCIVFLITGKFLNFYVTAVTSAIVTVMLYVIYRFVVSKKEDDLKKLWVTFIIGYLLFSMSSWATFFGISY